MLTNDVTIAATGQSINELRTETGADGNVRENLSLLDTTAIMVVEQFATDIHKLNNTHGLGALEQDIADAGELINKDKLRQLNAKRLNAPQTGNQKRLLSGGKR